MKCSRSITSAAEIGQLPYACVCLRGIFCLYTNVRIIFSISTFISFHFVHALHIKSFRLFLISAKFHLFLSCCCLHFSCVRLISIKTCGLNIDVDVDPIGESINSLLMFLCYL